jgi:hypothetical protein
LKHLDRSHDPRRLHLDAPPLWLLLLWLPLLLLRPHTGERMNDSRR